MMKSHSSLAFLVLAGVAILGCNSEGDTSLNTSGVDAWAEAGALAAGGAGPLAGTTGSAKTGGATGGTLAIGTGGTGGLGGLGGTTQPMGGKGGAKNPDAGSPVASDSGLPMIDVGSPLICGPVCAIYCPNGNVLDAKGCPTCKCKPNECPAIKCAAQCPYGNAKDANGCTTCSCNPPPKCPTVNCFMACVWGSIPDANGCETCNCRPAPACTAKECGPALGMPNILCSDGSVGGPVCQRQTNNSCNWVIRPCPKPSCDTITTQAACSASTGCHWLEPGCTDEVGLKLSSALCIADTELKCDGLGIACPTGKSCQKRMVNPCPTPSSPDMGACAACGATLSLCLPLK